MAVNFRSAPPVSPLLLAHLKEGRAAHTYLFTGPSGPAKNERVLTFARALNCGKNRFFESCVCLSCQKIGRMTHPDVRWFGENELAKSIKIEVIREILHEASLRPYEGPWKVFILEGADRLTLEASNALLKTLEEPPDHSVFLLLVENKAHLLETIQSRAFEVRSVPEPEKNPLDDSKIQLIESKGWPAFFEALKSASRPELAASLKTLLLYLRNRAAEEWEKSSSRSRHFLEALDEGYKVLKALDAHANQKLALTYLEIRLLRHFTEVSR